MHYFLFIYVFFFFSSYFLHNLPCIIFFLFSPFLFYFWQHQKQIYLSIHLSIDFLCLSVHLSRFFFFFFLLLCFFPAILNFLLILHQSFPSYVIFFLSHFWGNYVKQIYLSIYLSTPSDCLFIYLAFLSFVSFIHIFLIILHASLSSYLIFLFYLLFLFFSFCT